MRPTSDGIYRFRKKSRLWGNFASEHRDQKQRIAELPKKFRSGEL
ncbi:hypothetical protein DSM3645_23925 [Blastopirellula marina DSM 3645]|uniref:Uncharacterized protein n=1 Tax=Blastopirellula marina DSM 3645 TaxID=314230 RepID=A4A1J7_9BACT|nr:hypothetical protein DSM3645_23925 [Blastopirellula marina DSM 3645]